MIKQPSFEHLPTSRLCTHLLASFPTLAATSGADFAASVSDMLFLFWPLLLAAFAQAGTFFSDAAPLALGVLAACCLVEGPDLSRDTALPELVDFSGLVTSSAMAASGVPAPAAAAVSLCKHNRYETSAPMTVFLDHPSLHGRLYHTDNNQQSN